MKKAAKNNNIYAEAKEHALTPYRFAVEGSCDAEACVVFADMLSDAARTALEAACAGIGFADPVLLDASVFAEAGGADGSRAPDGLFEAVEALDPLLLVVADASAAALMGDAYRDSIGLDAHGFLFGRPYAAFSSFQRDLSDARSKQRDWALFKAMRKSADWLG